MAKSKHRKTHGNRSDANTWSRNFATGPDGECFTCDFAFLTRSIGISVASSKIEKPRRKQGDWSNDQSTSGLNPARASVLQCLLAGSLIGMVMPLAVFCQVPGTDSRKCTATVLACPSRPFVVEGRRLKPLDSVPSSDRERARCRSSHMMPKIDCARHRKSSCPRPWLDHSAMVFEG